MLSLLLDFLLSFMHNTFAEASKFHTELRTATGVNPTFHLIFYNLTSPCTVGDDRSFEGSTIKKIDLEPFKPKAADFYRPIMRRM
jgi:hypothetical protein